MPRAGVLCRDAFRHRRRYEDLESAIVTEILPIRTYKMNLGWQLLEIHPESAPGVCRSVSGEDANVITSSG